MQIGQGGSLPGSSGAPSVRPESAARPDTPRAQALEAARAALRRVPAVAADAEPAQAAPRRNLPRGTLINITV